MNKLISANYWFGCDWWIYEVGYLGMHAGQLSLACAVLYPWNTGHLRVTDPRMNSGFQQFLQAMQSWSTVPVIGLTGRSLHYLCSSWLSVTPYA